MEPHVNILEAKAHWFKTQGMTWQVTWSWPYGYADVVGQPDPFCRHRARKEHGARKACWCAWAVWTSARLAACGHAGCQFFAGFSPVNSSGRPLHDGGGANQRKLKQRRTAKRLERGKDEAFC
ncbi:hypothetical protein NC653_009774 [Populus alba x Populus x berolinensis]|uniref:Uncharacterized protein n=1 Tax=Populus alba x Populus x berolinensis TaxID=444605 RepID=A0AAD6R9W0_9ROSI|nr:hypothetical protein NC653_009774 [Populus alba x Populus x berolinensis]